MNKKLRRNGSPIIFIIIIIGLVAITLAFFTVNRRATSFIDQSNESHVYDMLRMIDRPFNKNIVSVFDCLRGFDEYITKVYPDRTFTLEDVREEAEYIERTEKSDELLFMDKRSSYITATGQTGVLDVTNDIINLFGNRVPFLKYLNWTDGQSRYAFALPIDDYTVNGKTCGALILLFRPETMNDLFRSEGFSGEAKVHAITTTGMVVFTNDEATENTANLLSQYRAQGLLTPAQVDTIKAHSISKHEGTFHILKDGVKTLFTYLPTTTYTMIMEVPEDVAAHEMNQLRGIILTASILIGTLVVIGVIAIIVLLFASSKRQAIAIEAEKGREAAEVANRAKTSFLFNMSHDIRTPMNAITGFTTMARMHVGDDELVRDYLGKIDVSAQQLLMLINQVLEMARIESGKVDFNEKPVNVRERFGVNVTVLGEHARARGLTFNHELADLRHPHVLADDGRLSQIMLNVVGNAIKYTPEGGTIDYVLREVEPRREGHATFLFTVADTGIGMSADYLRHLYEPFTRENTSTVSHIQGTGLGMSIVKSLVDLMGGTIDVQSTPGQGTRFDITLDLPINDKASAEDDTIPFDLSTFTLKGRRALLVEDNEMNREIARFILEEKGLDIDEADDGDVAVERIVQLTEQGDLHHYDFILMDVQMPRMNGYEATARIRAILEPLGVHIPIIALSANAFEEDRHKSRAAGMDDHVAKPIDITTLWSTLAKYI